MIIGLLSMEIFLPYSHSLKEKRQVITAFKERIRKKFNVAIAELDFLDKWQRARLGFITLNNERLLVEQVLEKIVAEAERNLEGEILRTEVRYL
ncbi:MAG: DUF503 domain-containing protein [Candidatus Aminicenantales bacterium]